ncbi:hypothetical protein BT69DRAFT_1341666 [Atractiella rhizophila]|nr:hypothetical protein BT69DRAFT_1341666 [Atractiella rhizophila]
MRRALPASLLARIAVKHVYHAQRRTFFGVGEILGVITNPAETLRSLTESKRLLDEARHEIQNQREQAQIPSKHTFSPLPGFWMRNRELSVIEASLSGIPSFTVLFGASSVGKTALLRQVLSSPRFHVFHFDLRISGFADLTSLYFSLALQMERFFAVLPDKLGKEWGWGEFEKESWAFKLVRKHDRLNCTKRLESSPEVRLGAADIARLMEMFQSALLSYWEFEPLSAKERAQREDQKEEKDGAQKRVKERRLDADDGVASEGKEGEKEAPKKLMPVVYLDEAHKVLPALVKNPEAMKVLLDSFLVMTKQDRLCQVLHATSDPFYMHWLRQMNSMQHAKIITIGDCSRGETLAFWIARLAPSITEMGGKLTFEDVWNVFGGKLAHIQDYVTDYLNSNGRLDIERSSHYLQAYNLLHFHILHSLSLESDTSPSAPPQPQSDTSAFNFIDIYSPILTSEPPPVPLPLPQLISIFTSLSSTRDAELPYFALCRKIGRERVDSLVRGRILELRWSGQEGEEVEGSGEGTGPMLRPISQVMRFAMGNVVKEMEEDEALKVKDNGVSGGQERTAQGFYDSGITGEFAP